MIFLFFSKKIIRSLKQKLLKDKKIFWSVKSTPALVEMSNLESLLCLRICIEKEWSTDLDYETQESWGERNSFLQNFIAKHTSVKQNIKASSNQSEISTMSRIILQKSKFFFLNTTKHYQIWCIGSLNKDHELPQNVPIFFTFYIRKTLYSLFGPGKKAPRTGFVRKKSKRFTNLTSSISNSIYSLDVNTTFFHRSLKTCKKVLSQFSNSQKYFFFCR